MRRGTTMLVAATLATALLPGCNGGGGDKTTVFFGSNGRGDCRTLTVRVSIDPDDLGACGLDPALAAAGCELLVAEHDGVVEINVLGCIVPESASLFSCGFDDIDALNVQRLTESLCGCVDRCDPFPPICVSTDGDRTSCEICVNGLDDDGNGEADCGDDNCRHVDPCATTTTSTSSTTTTSTTTSSTSEPPTTTSTTTTTLISIGRVAVDFDVTSASGPIGALQLAVDYSNAAGSIVGSGDGADCTSHVPGTIVSFNDSDATQTLHMGFISLEGVQAPVRVATCRFAYMQQAPAIEEFDVVVADASDPDLNPIAVNVEPEVLPVPSTTIVSTTTSSTSTTVPVPDPFLYTVTFDLTAASARIGALQIEAMYGSSPGDFLGSGANVECRSRAGTHRAFNDNHATQTLGMGFVSLNGIQAPATLARCRYRSLEAAPVPGDFTVIVTDASDPNFEDATATIKVRVSDEP